MTGIGSIVDLQLDFFASAPAIAPEVTGDMKRQPAGPHQQVSERLSRCAKRYAVKPAAVAALKHHAHVGIANDLGEFDAVGGEREARLGIALTIGARAIEQVHHLGGRAGRC